MQKSLYTVHIYVQLLSTVQKSLYTVHIYVQLLCTVHIYVQLLCTVQVFIYSARFETWRVARRDVA